MIKADKYIKKTNKSYMIELDKKAEEFINNYQSKEELDQDEIELIKRLYIDIKQHEFNNKSKCKCK